MKFGYSTVIFDCDGVILDSNRVKTDAFRQAALPYGDAAADELVRHHLANGGVSRYRKFDYFLNHIVPPGRQGPRLDELLKNYASAVREGLLTCQTAPGIELLRQKTPRARWLVASGGDQAELREIFSLRNIARYFDGGIFGSPDTKDEILARELASGNIRRPALFLGDSRYDHEAASGKGLDFIFVSGWSEFEGYADYVARHELRSVVDLTQLGSTLVD
jgi:phosphoglycolate phosphatase-like HAD superfamily hydrolase